MRECAAQLTRLAKQRDIVVIFVGHVTKDGAIAGPRVLEHIVDTVLYFEGDTHSSFRLVRAIKNRFGAANELGVFAMTERGLQGRRQSVGAVPVAARARSCPARRSSPRWKARVRCWSRSRRWSTRCRAACRSGCRSASIRSGSRCCSPCCIGTAAWKRRGYDVFVNAVGGVRINEPAADLAILLAVHSSLTGRPLPAKTLVFGEVGLAGEIRPVQRGQERIREAAKLGFEQVLIPNLNKPKQGIDGAKIIGVDRVDEALAFLRA